VVGRRAWQEDSYETAVGAGSSSPNSVDVKGDNEIWFSGSTKLDNGLEVGINIELEAGGNTDSSTSTASGNTRADNIDKSYVYVSGGFGKVIVGTESNGTVLMHTMAPDAAGNTGADGLLTGGLAIAKPDAVSSTKVTTEIDTDAEADKITYVAPSFYGFTVGGSYVPNANEDNQNTWGNGNSTTNAAAEIYGIAAMYANTFGGLGVKASAGWVSYDISNATDRSNEYAFGTQLSYAGFTLGGSYRIINENSGSGSTIANGNSASGNTWDIGLMYETGPWAVSAVYLKSTANGSMTTAGEDTAEIYQISGKYNMGAGVDLLATVGHAEYDDETAKGATSDANHNEGWAVMTGISLQF